MPVQATNRIPTLDGWRGIAILLVLLAHFQAAYLHHYLFGQRWLETGQHGVTIFFVLSGYLITSGLLAQDRISLRSFYIRRVFRILPPALFYLLFLVFLTTVTPMKAIGTDFWNCIFSVRNYLPETVRNTCTGHFWSLSVEEQFYFFWPACLALVGRKTGAAFAVLGCVVIAWFRMDHWAYYSEYLRSQYTQVRADALLVGCLMAIAFSNKAVRGFFTEKARWLFAVSLPVAAFSIYHNLNLIPLYESVAYAVLIGTTSLRPDMLPSQILELQHLKTTGLLSYSLYLWQQLFFRDTWGFIGPPLLIASVFFSWLLIERPFIALGRSIVAARDANREPAPCSI